MTLGSVAGRNDRNDRNDNSLAIAAAATAVIAASYWLFHKNKRHEKRSLPPQTSMSVIEVIRSASNFQLSIDLLKRAPRDGFTVWLPLPGKPVVVGDPDLMAKILNDKDSIKPIKFLADAQIGFGPSIFSETDTSKWKHRRKNVAAAFSGHHINRMNRVCCDHVKRWAEERLDPIIDAGETFDPGFEMVNMTMEIICESAFEFIPPREDLGRYLKELEIYMREIGFKLTLNPFRRYFPFLFPSTQRGYQAITWIQIFCLKFLDDHRSNPNALTGTVIESIAKNDSYQSDMDRVADINTFLVAGHDTTAYTVAWTLVELAKHPTEQLKLRKALRDNNTGNSKSVLELQNVIRESMRLNPVTPMVSLRVTSKDFVSKCGMTVLKGSNVFISQLLANHNPSFYENPDEFIPDRWTTPKFDESLLLPFASGIRNCAGRGLANEELYSVLGYLCAKYEFSLVEHGYAEDFTTMKPRKFKLKACVAK